MYRKVLGVVFILTLTIGSLFVQGCSNGNGGNVIFTTAGE